jgi:hypothetical protein
MSDAARSAESPPAVGRLSGSAVGRVSGRLSRLLGHSANLAATGRFLRRRLWVWPIIAAVLLAAAGWWVSRAVEGAMRQQRVNELTTILDADVTAVRVWIREEEYDAQLIARDEQLGPLVQELLSLADGGPGAERQLIQSKAQAAIRSRLKGQLELIGCPGFGVVAPTGVVVAADEDMAVGRVLTGYRKEFIDRVLGGRPAVSRPFRSTLLLPDENGEPRANLPTMYAAAPLRDAQGRPIAVLGLRIRPDDQFTRILRIASAGQTGETYAFDRNGLLLSQSRFDEDLKQIGLLVDQPDSRSILTLEVRDPQVNMAAGERPALRRADQPLTRMAADAVQGNSGYDADGYRDFRGVPVIGAWRWLDDYDFGVATEIEVAEAFRPEYVLRRAFWVLMGLLALCAAGIFLATLYIARQQKALRKATLAARQLGQYALEEKLGAGGMGTVYKARHALLRRPTAVKLLDVDKMSAEAIARFEREVQLTSALTHPNTVAVFDYGRTPEGIFYYAMEYLEGINLDDLVTRFGPLPEARAVHVLRQACGALAEAHAAGLVHRDVKPANVVLTRRGGLPDFVKVLDFGLVKPVGGGDQAHLTAANAVAGTPLYLAPEAVNRPDEVDARADVYALGAVGYFLLTGSPVFTGASVMEICMKHVQAVPEPPSARLGRPVSPGLEQLLLRCLAKSAADRPADAADLLRALEACAVAGGWTAEDAAAWWAAHGPAAGRAPPPGPAPPAGPTTAPPVAATVVYTPK